MRKGIDGKVGRLFYVKGLICKYNNYSFLYFYWGQLLRDKPLKEGFSFGQKCVVGIFTGILGIVLMYFSVRVGTILLDLRYLAVILAVIIG